MSVKSISEAFSAAVRRADEASGVCRVKPSITAADATKIAAAAGDFLDDGERAELEKVMRLSSLDPAGGSALQSALNKPKLTAEKRKTLIAEKKKDLTKTAGQVCGSVWFTLLLPGTCAITALSSVTITDKEVARLID